MDMDVFMRLLQELLTQANRGGNKQASLLADLMLTRDEVAHRLETSIPSMTFEMVRAPDRAPSRRPPLSHTCAAILRNPCEPPYSAPQSRVYTPPSAFLRTEAATSGTGPGCGCFRGHFSVWIRIRPCGNRSLSRLHPSVRARAPTGKGSRRIAWDLEPHSPHWVRRFGGNPGF